MSVTTPTANELFTVRVFKNLDIAVDRSWSNTYELQNQDGGGYTELVAAAQSIVTFEQGMCHDTVKFNRVVVSTYVPDGEPYAPASFTSIPLTQVGVITSPPAAEVLPLQVSLFLRRDVASGRTGKLFLRQTVGEDDVSGRFGSFVLSSPSGMATRLAAAMGASAIDDMFAGGSAPFRLVMAGNGPSSITIRNVTGFTPGDARLSKFNNRYYKRNGGG